MDSSKWCMECCAMYARRRLWCCHTSPTPSSGASSPMRSFISVVLPAPLAPMSAARESCVIFTLAFVRIFLSVPGYVNARSFMYITHLFLDLTPSRLPGSGNRMGLMCFGWSSPMVSKAYLVGAGDSLLLGPFSSSDASDATDALGFIPASPASPPMLSIFLMALFGDGNAATISGLRPWKSLKPIG